MGSRWALQIAKYIITIFNFNLLIGNKDIDFCGFMIWKQILLRQYLPRCRLFWTFCRNFLGSRFFPQPYLFILNHHWVLFSFHNIVIYKVNHVWSTWTLKRNCNWLLYVCMKLFMCRLCSESRLHFRFFLTLSV